MEDVVMDFGKVKGQNVSSWLRLTEAFPLASAACQSLDERHSVALSKMWRGNSLRPRGIRLGSRVKCYTGGSGVFGEVIGARISKTDIHEDRVLILFEGETAETAMHPTHGLLYLS